MTEINVINDLKIRLSEHYYCQEYNINNDYPILICIDRGNGNKIRLTIGIHSEDTSDPDNTIVNILLEQWTNDGWQEVFDDYIKISEFEMKIYNFIDVLLMENW